jgi:hypothetical protein
LSPPLLSPTRVFVLPVNLQTDETPIHVHKLPWDIFTASLSTTNDSEMDGTVLQPPDLKDQDMRKCIRSSRVTERI